MERPAPDDRAGWLKFVRGVDAIFGPRADAMLATAKARVETREIARRARARGDARAAFRAAPRGHAYIYIHGGAFVFGGGKWAMARAAATPRRWAAPSIRSITVWRPSIRFRRRPRIASPSIARLIGSHAPDATAIGGSSAGGNLALVTALMIRDRGLPQPAGLVLFTPEIDLTESGDTFQTNEASMSC